MSEDYIPICLTCKLEYEHYFASASCFYDMVTPFRDPVQLAKFEAWLGAHEKHDIRIIWEQSALRDEMKNQAGMVVDAEFDGDEA